VANTAGGYDPGTGNFNPPLGPGEYDVGYNIAVGGEYTVTEDYHLNPAVPEPRTYAFLVGLGMVGIFAIGIRRRTSSSHVA
jgi:hypothetical protein